MGFNEKLLQQIASSGEKGYPIGLLARQMNIKTKYEKKQLSNAIKNLLRSGAIIAKGKNKVCAASSQNLIRGVLRGNKRGFAFLIREDKGEDIFIPHRALNGAMHGDTVLAIKLGEEGAVVSVVKRGITSLAGTYEAYGKKGFVIPDDEDYFEDIFIPPDKNMGAQSGSKVVVNILDSGEGEVVKIIGRAGERQADILSILLNYGFNETFCAQTLNEAERIEYKDEDRKDFRDLLTITIDGEDARDFDDAISVEKTADGYKLYVHIADVAHYVKMGGAIDKEAYGRGTSVYFPESVFPMLPEKISNGVCSLKSKEDRLAISVVMLIDNKGNISAQGFYETKIRSDYRLTYDEVTKILEGDKELCAKYQDIVEMLNICRELAHILTQKRKASGMINFESSECKIDLDDSGEIKNIYPYPETISNNIIEQFMIAANETVASFIGKKKFPCVYRVHDAISSDKLADFVRFVKSLGHDIDLGENGAHPKAFSDFLEKVKGSPSEHVINRALLRSMQKAKYSIFDSGHFGLSLKNYCHFTAPIRRYPDLMVHRALKAIINNKTDQKLMSSFQKRCESAAIKSSEREIAAAMAERDVDDYYKALYMTKFIGHKFTGFVSGITASGLFVCLPNTVEGFVSLDDLPYDRYSADEKNYRIYGVKYVFTMSDKIEVKIKNSDAAARKIDMVFDGNPKDHLRKKN